MEFPGVNILPGIPCGIPFSGIPNFNTLHAGFHENYTFPIDYHVSKKGITIINYIFELDLISIKKKSRISSGIPVLWNSSNANKMSGKTSV